MGTDAAAFRPGWAPVPSRAQGHTQQLGGGGAEQGYDEDGYEFEYDDGLHSPAHSAGIHMGVLSTGLVSLLLAGVIRVALSRARFLGGGGGDDDEVQHHDADADAEDGGATDGGSESAWSALSDSLTVAGGRDDDPAAGYEVLGRLRQGASPGTARLRGRRHMRRKRKASAGLQSFLPSLPGGPTTGVLSVVLGLACGLAAQRTPRATSPAGAVAVPAQGRKADKAAAELLQPPPGRQPPPPPAPAPSPSPSATHVKTVAEQQLKAEQAQRLAAAQRQASIAAAARANEEREAAVAAAMRAEQQLKAEQAQRLAAQRQAAIAAAARANEEREAAAAAAMRAKMDREATAAAAARAAQEQAARERAAKAEADRAALEAAKEAAAEARRRVAAAQAEAAAARRQAVAAKATAVVQQQQQQQQQQVAPTAVAATTAPPPPPGVAPSTHVRRSRPSGRRGRGQQQARRGSGSLVGSAMSVAVTLTGAAVIAYGVTRLLTVFGILEREDGDGGEVSEYGDGEYEVVAIRPAGARPHGGAVEAPDEGELWQRAPEDAWLEADGDSEPATGDASSVFVDSTTQ